MYLGTSPLHHDTVGCILNFETGAVTPQYHVVYDELFTTVNGYLSDKVFDKDLWNSLISLDGLENSTAPEDQLNEDILCPALTWYELFQDANSDSDDPDSDSDNDEPEPDPMDSIPEGEDNDTGSVSSDETIPMSNVTSSLSSVSMVTRSRCTSKPQSFYKPTLSSLKSYTNSAYLAGTALQPPRSKPNSTQPLWKQEAYLAGSNSRQKVRSHDLQNQEIHSLNWNPDDFLARWSVKQT